MGVADVAGEDMAAIDRGVQWDVGACGDHIHQPS